MPYDKKMGDASRVSSMAQKNAMRRDNVSTSRGTNLKENQQASTTLEAKRRRLANRLMNVRV